MRVPITDYHFIDLPPIRFLIDVNVVYIRVGGVLTGAI